MNESYGITATTAELVRLRGPNAGSAIAPRGRVRTADAGHYASAFRGRGMEFEESRIYQPGDDVRTIDWRVSARTGRVHTKLFHEERERPVLLLLDERPSMQFGTRDAFKSVLAARAAATLAWTARDGGDRVGAMILTGAGHLEVPPRRSEARLVHLLRLIGDSTAERRENRTPTLAEGVARLVRVSRPGAFVFVISDFQDLDDESERQLGHLAQRAEVAALLVYDELETTAPRGDGLRVSDGSSVLRLETRDRRWCEEWQARFATRRERLERLCRRRGIGFLTLGTGESCQGLRADRLAAALRVRKAVGGRS
jgi:uncharacterized protein (DUF58 family)